MIKINQILTASLFQKQMRELQILEKERIFCKHDIDHLLSVARIMQIKVLEESLGIDKEVIYATALLHDLGRNIAYQTGGNHAVLSAKIAAQILPACDFDKKESEWIIFAISHHNDERETEGLCSLLRYADKHSRNCFSCPAYLECNWPDEQKNKGVEL